MVAMLVLILRVGSPHTKSVVRLARYSRLPPHRSFELQGLLLTSRVRVLRALYFRCSHSLKLELLRSSD